MKVYNFRWDRLRVVMGLRIVIDDTDDLGFFNWIRTKVETVSTGSKRNILLEETGNILSESNSSQ